MQDGQGRLSLSSLKGSTPSSGGARFLPRIASPATPWCSWATATTAAPDLTLAATAAAFHKADPHVWLATVEGSNSFDNVLPKLKASGAKRVWLQPFMIVAGDHANNDLAGPEEDSWASRIKAAGMTPMPNLKGLGQLKGIQDIFLSHTQNAVVDLANTKKAD
ncbi:MAG: sirohydrochlorin cobaltochelatase [Bilophila wadsworthia]